MQETTTPGRVRTSLARGHSLAGFTLLELTIAISILVIIMAVSGQYFVQSSAAFADLAQRSHLTARGQVVMDRMVREMISGRFVTLDPPIPTESSWIRFEPVVGFDGVTAVYGDPVQIELVPVNGQTQQAIRYWQDRAPYGTTPGNEDSPTLLAANLESGGLTFTRLGATLQIEARFQGTGDEPETLVLTSGVKMRNEE